MAETNELVVAIIAAGSALAGGIIAILGQWFIEWWRAYPQRKLDEARKAYLKEMLDQAGPKGWMKMETLSRVIGASKEDTARLPIELKARGNRQDADVWAYIKYHPFSRETATQP